MKKLLFVCLFCISLLTGCNEQKTNLNITDFIEVKYNDITIIPDDYNNIANIINNIKFNKKKINNSFNNKLIIKNNNDIHTFNISNNYNIKYTTSKETLYSSDSATIKQLNDYLILLNQKYTDNNFYVIEYINEYVHNEKDIFIKLDSLDNLVSFTTLAELYNFKVNSIEFTNNVYKDVNLLYDIDTLPSNQKIVIRKTVDNTISDFRISFETPYNYIVSIIPTYDEVTNKIIFKTDFKAK